MGKPQEALAQFRRVQTLGQDRPDVAFNLVRAELASGHKNAAKVEAQKEQKAWGGDSQWLGSVGQLFLDQGQIGEARTYLEAAVRLRPRDLDARRALAKCDLAQQQPEMGQHFRLLLLRSERPDGAFRGQ